MCKRGFKSTGHGNIPRLEPGIWIIAPPAARRVYIPNSKLAHQPKSQRAWEWGWADTRYLYARCESNFPPLWWCGQLPHPGYAAVCEISTSPGKGEGAGGVMRISIWSVYSSDEHFTRIDGGTSQRVVAGWMFSVIVWYTDERLSAKSFIWRGTAHMSRMHFWMSLSFSYRGWGLGSTSCAILCVSTQTILCCLLVSPVEPLSDSVILYHRYKQKLAEYLKPVRVVGKQWQLCFRASEHQYSARAFHEKCDNKGPTVTLVRVGHNVFGGYTDKSWGGDRCELVIIRSTNIPKCTANQ